jgi:hypothetical protein
MASEVGALNLKLNVIERAVAHLFSQGRAIGPTARLAEEIDAVVAEFGGS